MQLHGEAGVFVPDECHPPARHADHDVKTHRVGGIQRILPRRPTLVVAPGDLHVAECQGHTALEREAQIDKFKKAFWFYDLVKHNLRSRHIFQKKKRKKKTLSRSDVVKRAGSGAEASHLQLEGDSSGAGQRLVAAGHALHTD